MSKENNERANKKSGCIRPALLAILLLLAVYVGGVLYATQRFLPNTSIRGIDVSGQSPAEANESLKAEGLLIEIEEKDQNGSDVVSEVIDLAETANASVTYDMSAVINSQNKFAWFTAFFKDVDFDYAPARGGFDVNRLKLAVGKLYAVNGATAIDPKDAYVAIDGKSVTIVPEEEGNAVDRTVAIDEVISAAEAIMRGEGNQKIDFSELCKEPGVRAEDPELIAKRDKLEKIAGRTITINVTFSKTETLEGIEIVEFFDFDGAEVSINEEKLEEYIDDFTDRFYVNRYEYIKHDPLFEKLSEALLLEEDVTITADWYINYPQPRTNGNGKSSFVEISIKDQYLWYFENGKIILSTPIVTGHATNSPTPTGTFTIWEKARNARLVGKDYDLTVNFWMGIDHIGKKGIHDATWRGSFGGDIYTYNGSHGCVNLPYWAAESLFEHVIEAVTEVYIY